MMHEMCVFVLMGKHKKAHFKWAFSKSFILRLNVTLAQVMRMNISFGEVLTFGIFLVALLTYIDKRK